MTKRLTRCGRGGSGRRRLIAGSGGPGVEWSPSPRCGRSRSWSPTPSESRNRPTSPKAFVGLTDRHLPKAIVRLGGLGQLRSVAAAVSVDTAGFASPLPRRRLPVSVSIGISVDVICGRCRPCKVSVAGSASVTGAGMLSGGGEPNRARALLMPSPIALTRSAVTSPGRASGSAVPGWVPTADAAVIAQFHEHPEERLDHVDHRLGHPHGAQRSEQRQVLGLEEVVVGVAVGALVGGDVDGSSGRLTSKG